VSTKGIFFFKSKITETGSVLRLFRFIFETNENFVLVSYGVLDVIQNNQNKQICFKMNQIKPKWALKIQKAPKNAF